ncbi:MAG: endolytic transglycosylase MltG [Rhizomicrobium sp.]
MSRLPAILLLIAAIVTGAWAWERSDFAEPGPAARNGAPATVVDIAAHQGLMRIAGQLERAGVVRSAAIFAVGVRLRREGARLKAGEYSIASHLSMLGVADLLVSGRVIEHKLTAAEGLTSQMIAGLVNANRALAGPFQSAPAEGSLLPETYLFTKGTQRRTILARMHAAQTRFVAEAWAARAPDLPFASPGDAVTLASIVEKETAIPEERRHIAAVFINRLRLGMKLESDPTVIYGLSRGYPLGHGLRASELASVTPFNTYQIAGLPPTPICNPGKDSISAVLNPEISNDLYFVANGTGGHAFAATKAEQDRNVARWRQIENATLHPKP